MTSSTHASTPAEGDRISACSYTSRYRSAIRRGIEIERHEPIGELLDVAAHPAVHPVADDFADGAPRKCEHRRAARHRFDHDETERLVPLNREQQRSRPREERVLHREVGFTDVLDVATVDERQHLAGPVVGECGLDLAGQLEPDARAPRGLNREMRPLTGRHPPQERDVVLLLPAIRVLAGVDPVVDHVDVRHRLALAQPLGDGDVVDVRVPQILLRQGGLVRVMDCQNRGHIRERRERNPDDVVEVDDVDRIGGLADRPRRVVHVLEL
jgi:hypothetical protein